MASVGGWLKHAWNAFTSRDVDPLTSVHSYGSGGSLYVRPFANSPTMVNTKSIIGSIYNRIGIDVANIVIQHVRLDKQERYAETIKSGLNNCLTLEANLDQGARAFRQDMAMTLFDKGVIAIVPIETTLNPNETEGYDILKLRVGYVVDWYPKHVRVSVYNEDTGRREELTLAKKTVAIVENPLYTVMNEPNSTLQRLIRKLSLLDAVDEQSSSGKLDLIIQLPYVIKSEARKQQADQRRKDIEMQLKGSQYGIAYTDGTERITQLNRPAENNLMKQIEYLTAMLYGQLGLTEAVFNGTADEAEMLNYYNRTLKPIVSTFCQEMKRTFLTKTARTQGHSIEFYRDPFENVTTSNMGDLADKLTRNEIASSNEIRQAMGWKPVDDAKADELRNKNIPAESQPGTQPTTG